MSSDRKSASTPAPSPGQKPSTSAISEMLTPSELESLRRAAKEGGDYARKAFAKYRPANKKQDVA